MNSLSTLGIVHTAFSVVALIAGAVCLVRDREITLATRMGQAYVVTTVLTCLTALGIFHHGGFGPPHVLAILTLIALAAAAGAEKRALFGAASSKVEVVCYSLTFFFSMIPGVNETTTRLPPGAPLFSSPEANALKAISGVMFVLFLVGVTLQLRRARAVAR